MDILTNKIDALTDMLTYMRNRKPEETSGKGARLSVEMDTLRNEID